MRESKHCQEELERGFSEFLNHVKKVNKSRTHKIRNSYGVYDGFKYYRKNKPKGDKYILTESQYFAIIRKINKSLSDLLISGEDINLPLSLGRLEIRKYNSSISLDGDKIKTNLPIDWCKTLKLWHEDSESYRNKTLVRFEEREIYKIYYNRNVANFANKSFYQFNINRELKKRLKQSIKDGKLDAFII